MMMKPYGGLWRVEGFAGGGTGGEGGSGELHSSVNDFLAVQRDVKDRLT